jgi:hypothetical protein
VIDAVLRRLGHVVRDPVLRRWLFDKAMGRIAAGASFPPHCPPYMGAKPAVGPPRRVLPRQRREAWAGPPALLRLPNDSVEVSPSSLGALFECRFDDLESYLALRRFAWLPLQDDVPPELVDAIWLAWKDCQGARRDGWAWHPYTAAERAINVLDFAFRHGLSAARDDDERLLADHASAILDGLEYFGEQGTGNHLANNGRGLLHIGRALAMPEVEEAGRKILVAEAKRIFGPGGMLREGSSHYHLLLTRTYVEAWLLSRGQNGEAVLEETARQALSALNTLALPGRFPLVGDISPDSPPEYLSGLLPGHSMEQGWAGRLLAGDRAAVRSLRGPDDGLHESLRRDGWWRGDWSEWCGLWYVAPDGFPPAPGHGHQDCGGFELHWRGHPLFLDLGRGTYGARSSDCAEKGQGHNSLLIDGHDPYPSNRPYYDDAFRRRIAAPPTVARDRSSIAIDHDGYRRIGIESVRRHWLFDRSCVIQDRVDGSGTRHVERLFHTPWPVSMRENSALIAHPEGVIRIQADVSPVIKETRIWTAYGRSERAFTVAFGGRVPLPWTGKTIVEPL